MCPQSGCPGNDFVLGVGIGVRVGFPQLFGAKGQGVSPFFLHFFEALSRMIGVRGERPDRPRCP